MATVSTIFIIFLEVSHLIAIETFPYDVNAGPLPLSASSNSRREKRETCELTPGLFSVRQKLDLRAAHNNYRRKMEIPATKMMRLGWNIQLAQRAQALADTCVYAHDKLLNCDNRKMGQNLFVTWGVTVYPKLNVTQVVEAWHNEINYYNLETNSCDAVCGHYKQVVWWRTKFFGCGYAYCDTLIHPGASDKKKAVFVVCDYSPAGNYADGKPYTAGTSCSECPEGTKCKNDLCIPDKG